MPTDLQNKKTFNNYSIILSDSKYLQQTQVFTRLNPNLQTQANPSSKNPKLKIAFLFLTNSDLHFAPLWQQIFQNAPSKNLYNVYVHPILPSMSPALMAPSSNSTSFRRKKPTAARRRSSPPCAVCSPPPSSKIRPMRSSSFFYIGSP